MRHMKSGRKLSRRKEHRTAMLANLAASLVKHGSVRTTDAKAKEVRPFIERLVTFARRGDLHARRIVLSRLKDSEAVNKLFEEYGPKFTARPGGYTRILKLGFRPGDNSAMSLIQFVDEEQDKKGVKKQKARKAKPKPVANEEAPKKTPDTTESQEPTVPAATVEAESVEQPAE